MVIVGLALIATLIVLIIMGAARLFLGRKKPTDWRAFASWLGALFVINFILDLLILYFSMPTFAGPYGGWEWIMGPLLISGIASIVFNGVVAGQRFAEMISSAANRYGLRGDRVVDINPPRLRTLMASGGGGAGVIAIVVAILVTLVISPIITVATTWFDPNAKALAAIPHVTTMPIKQSLPPTDVNHIVLVPQAVAFFKGQQVLGQNGQNLGSTYHIEQNELTLQSVQHHLYWIAPLVYNNIWANIGNYSTPALVVVDAESPEAQAQLRTGYHLHYVPDALFNQDLLRHVYLSGYTNGDLADPTLEVDDNWHPYFTISLMQPSRGFTGEVVHQVLLVDPQNGDITPYNPLDVPSWVDRVIPSSVVSDYLGWWGLYKHAPWFDPAGTGQQDTASDPELVYNNVDQPVWLVPMTSSSGNDSSSTGVFLFDTKQNAAQFYPLAGLGVGDNVTSILQRNPTNIRNYDVSSVQLYEIYGVPTWVGVFTQSTSQGDTFQAVGLVAANHLNGGDVQMAPSLNQALVQYQQWLASNNLSSASNPGGGPTQVTFTGKVVRVAPITQGNNTFYYLWIEGQSHIFEAPLSLSPLLPLVQPGDTVTGTYVAPTGSGTQAQVIVLNSFNDTSIQLATPTPAPSGTPQPTPTP
jgi:hypothetical protein